MIFSSLLLLSVIAKQDSPTFRDAPSELLPSKVFATLPDGTFLENILSLSDGDFLVDSYLNGTVYRLKADGSFSIFAETGGKIAGIAAVGKKGYVVSGWTKEGAACVYEIPSSGKKIESHLIEGGMFPNGVEQLAKDRYLIADSYAGVIWEYRPSTHSTSLWIKDASFQRANLKDGTPGVNGIRLHQGYLYYSNTNAHTFSRLKLNRGLKPQGAPELLAHDVNFDDFAIDSSGNVFATTHILNSLEKLRPDGTLTTVAGLEQGLAGSTSVVFGRTGKTRHTLFVATNGGLSVPPPGGVQPGKVVQIDTMRQL